MSPSAHLGDGHVDLILVRKGSRLDQLKYLLRTASKTASPFDLDHVQVHRVREFTFRLEQTEPQAVWNCDGEVLDAAEVRVRAHRKMVRMFGATAAEARVEKSGTLETILDVENDDTQED